MKAALLDVNVLIALIDPAHEFHESAHAWFERNRQFGWATCPITENACLRILGKPAYPYLGLTVDDIRDILAEFRASGNHLFWPDSLSMLNRTHFDLAGVGPKQLTDIYLIALATAHDGRMVTFDRGIRRESVTGAAKDAVEVIT
jgi:toxin-antitoxin system PIN domain toxin